MTLTRTRDRHRDDPENPPSVIDILFSLSRSSLARPRDGTSKEIRAGHRSHGDE